MNYWSLRTTSGFDKSLHKLDQKVQRQIQSLLLDLCELENPRTRGKALTGRLSGYWRYRIGDFRILVEIHDSEFILLAIDAAHRSRVYRR